MRLAVWDVDFSRDGPGLLLRDIQRGEDAQIAAAITVIERAAPDVIVLFDFDTDAEGRALSAFAQVFGETYPNRFTRVGNEGRATGVDMDGNGTRGSARDTAGFGRFSGNGGIAVMARDGFPLEIEQSFSDLLWRDLPGALLASDTLPEGVETIQPLSSTRHDILRAGPLRLLIHAATPPVFDGPEDRNGRRNHDETALWGYVLDGALGAPVDGPFAIAAKINTDPLDGEGRKEALRALLDHPRLQDPQPASDAAAQEATPGHVSDPAHDTANWDDPVPGNLRVDYILPSREMQVIDAGVMWPAPGSDVALVSRHGLVWVDLRVPEP